MQPTPRSRELVLLGSVFAVAVAGLVYELVAGTLSTYLLGSSVTVFSLVIGVFLSAMGLGAFLAKYIQVGLARAFIVAELALALVGGLSALGLFAAYAYLGDGYVLVLGLTCVLIGALVGVEIPILIRILEEKVDVRVAVSHVLALDYAGALVGSVAFPLVLLPHVGVVRSAVLFGLMNLAVAVLALYTFRDELPRLGSLITSATLIGLALFTALITGGTATTWLEDQLYADPVLIARSTPYQRLVVTKWRSDVRLYVEGHLQFSSVDEYRYHEALAHPALAAAGDPKRVLILGGGDGLLAREVLGDDRVRQVTIVDLDPAVTELFSEHHLLTGLNKNSLSDPRVAVVNDDAVRFLERTVERWDVILMDLPDPNDPALSRLYTKGVYQLAARRLTATGAMATQATSPFYAGDAYWCIVQTIEAALADSVLPRSVHPYHAHVPSFGEWGFVLVSAPGVRPATLPTRASARFLDDDAQAAMYRFPRDLERREVDVNRLSNGVLARYYRAGWARFHGP